MATSDSNSGSGSASVSTVSSSLSDIYSKYLNLAAAQNYLSPDSTSFGNLDFLRSGMFGWIMESLAMFTRDSAFQKTMLYNEKFLNTAVMPSSVYNWAKMYNVNVMDAVPAGRYVTMTVSTASIDSVISSITSQISDMRTKYGISNTGSFMVLDKSNRIQAGSHYFSLEHSIQIYHSSNNAYIVSYCTDEISQTTSYGDYSSPIIQSNVRTIDGATYLEFTVQAFQYRTIVSSKTVTSNSVFDTKSHLFTYSDQLCGLQVWYSKGTASAPENVTLKFSNIDQKADSDSLTKVAYYSVTDSNTLEIDFAASNKAGLPQAGSTIEADMFETEGSGGNINFTGDAVFLLSQEDYRSVAITAAIGDVIQSGQDQSSLSDIKNKITTKLSTRGVIITESDLDDYFYMRSAILSDTKDSLMRFRRVSDNLIRRVFSAQLKLRDGVTLSSYDSAGAATAEKASSSYLSSMIPTNTVDVMYVPSAVSPTGSYTILPSDVINCFLNDTGTGQSYVIGTNGTDATFSYTTPFYIVADVTDGNAAYFYCDTDVTSSVSVIHTNATANTDRSSAYFLITSVSLYHSSTMASGSSLQVNPDYSITFTGVTTETAGELSARFAGMTMALYKTKTVSVASGISVPAVSVALGSSDSGSSVNTFTAVFHMSISGSSPFNASAAQPTILLTVGDSAVSVESAAYLDFSFVNGMEVMTSDPLTFFYSLDDTMQSDVRVGYRSNVSGSTVTTVPAYVVIRNVPVVAKWWVSSAINKRWLIRQLGVYIKMLRDSSDVLDANTFFAIRFSNTYGYSKTFNTATTNLRLRLKIYLDRNSGSIYAANTSSASATTDTLTILENDIRDYARMLVDNANDNGYLDISSILASLRTYAAWSGCILHVDFMGLNGSFTQYVKKVADADILEYFSLDERYLTDDITFDSTGEVYAS